MTTAGYILMVHDTDMCAEKIGKDVKIASLSRLPADCRPQGRGAAKAPGSLVSSIRNPRSSLQKRNNSLSSTQATPSGAASPSQTSRVRHLQTAGQM